MLRQTRRTNRIHSTTLHLPTIQSNIRSQLERLDGRELQKVALKNCIPEEFKEVNLDFRKNKQREYLKRLGFLSN